MGAEALDAALRETFGFSALRPGQDEVVAAVMAGADVLAVMPTGSGKSLCYQLPAVAQGGLTLVVSPLIALMRDQVAAMRALGVAAASLSSANPHEENMAALDQAAAGELRLLYAAPERLASAGPAKPVIADRADADGHRRGALRLAVGP